MATRGWDRRHRVHAHHVRLDRAAEDRAALVGRHPQLHRLGRRPVRHRPGHEGAQLRAAQLRPLPARHLDHAEARRLRRPGRPGPRRRTAATSPTCIADNEVDVVQSVPMLYRLLIDATREGGGRFPSVKHVITTGDKIPATLARAASRLFPNARVFNIYGCTETNDSFMHDSTCRRRGPGKGPDRPAAARRRRSGRGRGRGALEGAGARASCSCRDPVPDARLPRRGAERRHASSPVPTTAGESDLLPHRRHRPPRRRRPAQPRGPDRLLRQGPRRPGQHAGGGAGDPGAPRRGRGSRRRRARRDGREASSTRSCCRSPTAGSTA